MKKIKVYLILILVFENGILYAKEESNISPLQAAIETALHANEELNTKISIINKSANTYIPFEFESEELPFVSFDYIRGKWPYLNAAFPEKYEVLCLFVDVKIGKYKIIFSNNGKVYFHEIYLNESNMLIQYSFVVNISEDVNKKLIKIIHEYKKLNNLKKKYLWMI